MTLRYDPELYSSSSFDDDMCLKPPLLLWLAVIYLTRAILLPIAIGVGHFAGVDQRAFDSLRSLWSSGAVAPALVALPLLYALIRRGPGAGRITRWIFARGRILVVVSAAIDLGLSAIRLGTAGGFGDESIVPIGSILMDGYFLVYVLAARRVRDSFSDFPPPNQP
jgi:hypothetical protein